ncbi:hypothetical protein ACFV84_37750, partial [Kitasatospora sp. NPDC059811]|uniref:hypothetical protein n=1 Tax=Kitasatospora sp. NPDC059811 TaxID=3346957 RepID=UPI0036487DA7
MVEAGQQGAERLLLLGRPVGRQAAGQLGPPVADFGQSAGADRGQREAYGAAVGRVLDWMSYERILPFSGAFGFLVCWYVLFLAGYFT